MKATIIQAQNDPRTAQLFLDGELIAETSLDEGAPGPINVCNRLIQNMIKKLELPLDMMEEHRPFRIGIRIMISQWLILNFKHMEADRKVIQVGSRLWNDEYKEVITNA